MLLVYIKQFQERMFDANNLDVGQELQTPSSALIYDGKPHNFESEPVIAFFTGQHSSEYNVFLNLEISGLERNLT